MFTIGFSIYNLRNDPYELTDLSGDEQIWEKLSGNFDELVKFSNTSDFLTSCIEKEHNIGYAFPITGANYNFWKIIFRSLRQDKVLEFMRNSGRLNGDEYGIVTGTSYCTSNDNPEDTKLLSSIILRQKERKNRSMKKRKLILSQYGYKIWH